MARPAETYRGARRNHAREYGWGTFNRFAGDNWRKTFDNTQIKYVPAQRRGWDYRYKGRAGLNEIREAWRALRAG